MALRRASVKSLVRKLGVEGAVSTSPLTWLVAGEGAPVDAAAGGSPVTPANMERLARREMVRYPLGMHSGFGDLHPCP